MVKVPIMQLEVPYPPCSRNHFWNERALEGNWTEFLEFNWNCWTTKIWYTCSH